MGVAFSEQRLVYGTISGDPASFLDDLHVMLAAAGWTSAVYGTGYVYAMESPQGLAVQVRIWDQAEVDFPDCLSFQWLSSVYPYPPGLVHRIRLDAAISYAVWVNCCSVFIGRAATNPIASYPYSVSGGVIWASGLTTPTPECEAQSPPPDTTTNELWWSCGADANIPAFAGANLADFRRSFWAERYSFCWNGTVTNSELATISDALQLGPIRSPGYFFYQFAGAPQGASGFFDGGIVWKGGTPLLSDPLVFHRGTIYGQLWDACIGTEPMDKEANETVYESVPGRTTSWRNYMHKGVGDSPRERFYALLLLTGIVGAGDGNIAY